MKVALQVVIIVLLKVILQHFEPTTNKCLAIPWLREVGFTIVFGILNLRLYK